MAIFWLWNSKATGQDGLCASSSEWFASLRERPTRGRRLVVLGLSWSARSVFFPLKSQLLSKHRIAHEIKHPYARWFDMHVAKIFLRHVWKNAPQEHGGVSREGWCIHPTLSPDQQSGARLGAGARLSRHHSWECLLIRSEPNSGLFRIRSCLGDRAGLPRACKDAARTARAFSALAPCRHPADAEKFLPRTRQGCSASGLVPFQG